jgi:uncharacterized membrane protein YuzA (DUF378 family)
MSVGPEEAKDMGNPRRFDLRSVVGVTIVSLVLLLAGKIDGVTFAAFIFIGVCGTVGATYRMRSDNDDSHPR